jgi:hypothetical protein
VTLARDQANAVKDSAAQQEGGNIMRVAIGGYIAAANSFVGYRMDLAQFPRSTLTRDAVFK